MQTTVESRTRQLALIAQAAFVLGLLGIAILFGIWASNFQLIGGNDEATSSQVIAYDVVLAFTLLALLVASGLASASTWPALRVLSIVALLVLIGEVVVLGVPEGQLLRLFGGGQGLPPDYVPCVTGGDDPRCT